MQYCEEKWKIKHEVSLLPFRKKPNVKLDFQSAAEWSKAFEMNNDLIHLDLSHNNFDARELKIMKEGLEKNDTLIGLHIKGNEGTLDSKGFIRPAARDGNVVLEEFAQYSQFQRIKPVLKMGQIKNPHKKLYRLNANSNCWICEGWEEY